MSEYISQSNECKVLEETHQVNLDENENSMEVDEMEKMELDEPNLNIDIKCSKCMKKF